MDVIERIKSQLSASPVVLYMKGTPDFPQCGFSAAAVRALSASGAQFAHVNIFEDPELREALKQYSNWPTYPQLYVNGELVGGSDIILEMYKSGELQKLVTTQRSARHHPRAVGIGLPASRDMSSPHDAVVEAVAHLAEQLRRALRIVRSRMRFARIPADARCL